ncbi:MAG: ribosomal L7Ae/L30e/S12e/Gadd45 family protein [Clostridia bacterium]|nr:ribosomal L7Ae/L30e/S12e/Gadd45 family protein [Clostridia bacterium]
MNDRFFDALGLCRRAGRLSWGRESSKESIRSHKAKLILVTSDASDRIRREFKNLSENEKIEIMFLEENMQRIKDSIGLSAGVVAINDEGFAKLLKKNSQ